MSNELELVWPKAAMIHPNFLNYCKVGTMRDKTDEYIKTIGVTTDREFQIHELQVFCGNLSDTMAGDLADGVRVVKWADLDTRNYIVTFPLRDDRTCGIHIK